MSGALLEASAVTRRFGRRRGAVTAVDRVSMALEAGASCGLVGESGCGKTTLGRMLAGLEAPERGEIRYRGRALRALDAPGRRAFRRGVQFVFQDPIGALNPRKTARGTLEDAAGAWRRESRSRRGGRVSALAERVGLAPGLLERYPHELSGGQAQRVVIARALAVEPQLLILDEPVSALDVSVQAQLLRLLKALRADLDLAYLLISHDLAVVEQLCEEVSVMRAGAIIESGPCRALFRAPQHRYTRELIEAAPVPGAG